MSRLLQGPGLALLALATACTGTIGNGGGDDPVSPGPLNPSEQPPAFSPDSLAVGGSEMSRLTARQYANAVSAVFGPEVQARASLLPPDRHVADVFAAADQEVMAQAAAQYQRAANDVARQAAPLIALRCDVETNAAECGFEITEQYAPRLFRRSVSREEQAPFASLFEWSLPEDGALAATELVISALLQAPEFLYIVERVPDGAPTLLDDHAMVTRLALFLWNSVPDEELLRRAGEGGVNDPEVLAELANAMLDDPRADEAIAAFYGQWTKVERGLSVTDETLLAEMVAETETFAVDNFRQEATLRALFTGRESVVGERLAEHYGSPSGRTHVPGHYGILTHASIMTASAAGKVDYTRPVHRGNAIRSQVLCVRPRPAPPVPDLEEREAELNEDMTTRQRLEHVTQDAYCQSCHATINPLGFAFETFDEFGRFSATDVSGQPVDNEAIIRGEDLEELNGDFEGTEAFVDELAASDMVRDCMSRQWMRFALRRSELDIEERAIERASEHFDSGEFRQLLLAIVQSEPFRYRVAEDIHRP